MINNDKKENDDFLDYVLDNFDVIMEYCEENYSEASVSANSSKVMVDLSHPMVITHKKRKYEWKIDPSLRKTKPRKVIPPSAFPLPRILKSDIRRKYSLMFANVMNSYDYDLMSSFFFEFMKPDLTLEKRSNEGFGPRVLAQNLDLVLKYFLVLLQLSPDKVTRISELSLKRSSSDISRTEVCCKFSISNNAVYDFHPKVKGSQELCSFLKEMPKIQVSHRAPILPNKRRTICTYPARNAFDPVSGVFLSATFKRLEKPIHFQVEGELIFVVNEGKWIESIIINNMRKIRIF